MTLQSYPSPDIKPETAVSHVANRWCCLTWMHLPRGSEERLQGSLKESLERADWQHCYIRAWGQIYHLPLLLSSSHKNSCFNTKNAGRQKSQNKDSPWNSIHFILRKPQLCGLYYFTSGQWKLDSRPALALAWPLGTSALAKIPGPSIPQVQISVQFASKDESLCIPDEQWHVC